MVPTYLDFDVLVETGSMVEGPLCTLSECGSFQAGDQLNTNKVELRNATGAVTVLDRYSKMPSNEQLMVHPISTLVSDPTTCK